MPTIIICPGIHDAAFTESFISGLFDGSIDQNQGKILVFPGKDFSSLSAWHILEFLRVSVAHRRYRLKKPLESPLIFISFSAGVVGAIGAAHLWQLLGGRVKAFIAIDGWGVLLQGNFPIHRMSHDYFTHWSSSLLGCGQYNFYAEPAVDHMSIWRSPETVQGWGIDSSIGIFPPKGYLSAAAFLRMLLEHYEAN
ncbi:hypothetical protein VF14_32460 [Nostoc linckia z18]|uniref:Alpha/beta hydrolase n=1 Tax=Nostoc linckia z8 TaxID=1628746 RepID=A0A9Q6ELD5_NOSLI|nr:hypothetical protein [Nostoc linckia]PHK33804.1 hypothetical protein VF12_24800 [Nostoc linckia z15]PHK41104.1 hypothetical protein VF13_31825 [Nostoc linckia z16]PHJ56760.1 hypothetical protein VF02_32115 [Nostoc linckia z1]PHJ58134.1 hypothetical protein VF03_35785 [Nostoc linckia z2]PHJ62359.1 hypothetical protein VF05_26950 [Nostoc linckia z3]